MKYQLALILLCSLLFSTCFAAESAPPLPTKSSQWLDGHAYQWNDFHGKVVLLNVWTFMCWNSYRSLPWIVSLQKKYPDLQIIGVHSPEFDSEKDRHAMCSTMANYQVKFPQILDDSHEYWNKLHNTYWPAFYVIDKSGNIRGKFAGETHADDAQAHEIERLIENLRKE